MTFDEAFDRLLGHEGDFSDHPDDPGGATRYGITERVARKHGYRGDMRDLPIELAKQIARAEYWDAVRADELSDAVRFDVFDGAYHSSPKQSIKWLQRAAGVKDDGDFGQKTMLALRFADPHLLSRRYNHHRLRFMTDLKGWPVFGKGWARRIADNLLGAD